jgi:hypothetical protein
MVPKNGRLVIPAGRRGVAGAEVAVLLGNAGLAGCGLGKVTAGVTGTSKICTTSQGILGYVKVASDANSFEIKSYSTSPPASLFRLPRGATVTKPAAGAS